MNKLIIALSVACASACVFADSTVGATPSKITTNDWFSAKVDANGLVRSNGSFENSPTAPEFDTVNKKIVIDSELANPVTFTANAFTSAAKDMAEVTFNLDTAIVPADVRNETSPTGAKVAFAASEGDDSKGYYAWLGSSWVQLSGTPKADGESYNLGVTFKGDKVQFKVDGVALTHNQDEWLSYGAGAAVPTTMAIDLVGSGNVTSFVGSQLKIEAEIVNDPTVGPIEVPEADAKLLAKDTTLEAALAADAGEGYGLPGMTVGTAYAIGLIKAENGEMKKQADGIVVKAVATAKITDNKLPVQFVGFTPTAQGNNVELSYQLKGETGDGVWEEVGDPATDIANIKIPADKVVGGKKYRYFKVVTTVGVPAN